MIFHLEDQVIVIDGQYTGACGIVIALNDILGVGVLIREIDRVVYFYADQLVWRTTNESY